VYAEFYGLKELPFALTPDPRFIYFTPSHTEVMANLHYGIESGKGLVVVTGEVGTGKTTILRWMMERLDRTVLVAYIFNPRLSVPEFTSMWRLCSMCRSGKRSRSCCLSWDGRWSRAIRADCARC